MPIPCSAVRASDGSKVAADGGARRDPNRWCVRSMATAQRARPRIRDLEPRLGEDLVGDSSLVGVV